MKEMIFNESTALCPYLKEMQREARRQAYIQNEKKSMEQMIDHAFENVDDPKREYWANRVKAHWNRRLKGCTKARWVTFISEMTDSEAYGSAQQKKMKEYLIRVRDEAAKEVRKSKRGLA